MLNIKLFSPVSFRIQKYITIFAASTNLEFSEVIHLINTQGTMKRVLLSLLVSFMFVLGASAMGYREARERAWFLTDKMAYELNLSPAQYDRAYEINLDYFLHMRSPSDCSGHYWRYRDADLRCILFDWQYRRYCALDYFFRPVRWHRSAWFFPVCNHYRHNHYYFKRPQIYVTYRGGRWHNRKSKDRSPYYGMHFKKGHGMRDHYKPLKPGWRGHDDDDDDDDRRGHHPVQRPAWARPARPVMRPEGGSKRPHVVRPARDYIKKDKPKRGYGNSNSFREKSPRSFGHPNSFRDKSDKRSVFKSSRGNSGERYKSRAVRRHRESDDRD